MENMNDKSKDIYDALCDADWGKDAFNTLKEISTGTLSIMNAMISYILTSRNSEE